VADAVQALAHEIARATVQRSDDRSALHEAARAIAHGPERQAARVGYAIAAGVLEELKNSPPPPLDLTNLFTKGAT
jgi:hypothetical protein